MEFFKLVDHEWEPELVDDFIHVCSQILILREDEFSAYWKNEIAGFIRSIGQLVREGKLNEAQFDNAVKCASEISDIPSDLLFISWLMEEASRVYKARYKQAANFHFLGGE